MSARCAGSVTDLLATLSTEATCGSQLRFLIEQGADRLPMPGSGQTLERWRILAATAAHDLSLVKLFEGHTDALAILRELGCDAPSGVDAGASPPVWGTWCAEPPDARLESRPTGDGTGVRLTGRKAWCSGAESVTHAIVSCWDADGEPVLAAVALDQPAVTVTGEGWHAVGMAATRSVDVVFDGAAAVAVGAPGQYVGRPGFWQGGAGIAACWYGGAQGIADRTRRLCGPRPDPHRLAHLGAIDVALAGAAAVLREAAAWIDTHPSDSAQLHATRSRMVCERAATDVIGHAGRALGAAPFCRDARFTRAAADLPVFIRQSHAERDLAALGGMLLAGMEGPWNL